MKFNSVAEVQKEREKVALQYDGNLPEVLADYFEEEEKKQLRAEYYSKKAIERKKYDWDDIKEYKNKKEKEFWENNETEIVKTSRAFEGYEEPLRATEALINDRDLAEDERRYIITLCEYDINLFAVRYFPHYLKKPSSKLHRYLYDLVVREFKKSGQFKWAIAAPRGNAKCLWSGTLIQLSDGTLKKLSDLDCDDRIVCLGDNLKLTHDKVRSISAPKDREVFDIVLRSGRKLSLTKDHRLFSINGATALSDLSVGDKIATPRRIECYCRNTMSSADAIFLANIIAEGCLSKGRKLKKSEGYSFKCSYTNFDKEVVDDFKVACANLGFGVRQGRNKKYYNVTGATSYLRRYKLGGHLATDKLIPNEVFNQDNRFLEIFISRFIATDGWISKYNPAFGITLANEKLIDQLFTILLRLGFVPVKQDKPNNKSGAWAVVCHGVDQLMKLAEIGVLHKQNKLMKTINKFKVNKSNPNLDTIPYQWRRFLNNVTPHFLRKDYNIRIDNNYNTSRQKVKQVAEIDNNEFLLDLACSDIYWDEIVSISDGYYTETYDIETKNNSNFIANNIFSHNSSIVSTILPTWCIVFKKKKFIVQLSNTAGQAEDFLSDVKNELMYNELLRQDFPEACTKGEIWRLNEIRTANGVRVRALGTGSEVRGRKYGAERPDLIICHEKGTKILYNDKWINIEDHPSAISKVSDGFEIKVCGLPFSETVTREHRYFCRTITKFCNKNYLDDPVWIEARNIENKGRKKYYIGYKINYEIESPHAIPAYNPTIKNRDVSTGKITAVDNKFRYIIPDEFYDTEFWWFVGLWWGDGYSSGKHQLNITIADKDIYIFDRLKELLLKYNRKWSISKRDSACFQVIFSWSKFARWLKSWRVGNSMKIPPIWVEKLPMDCQKELIRGYIDADGFVDENKQEVRLTSIYLDGLLCVRRILSRFGIAASIRKGLGEHTEYIKNRKINCAKKYDLRFRDNAYKLGYNINNQTRYKYTRAFIKDGYFWSKVNGIKEVEDKIFIPIKTDNSEYTTYFGISHNCDDLEDSEMVRSEKSRDFVRFHWFDKDVLFAGDEKTDFLVVGTILGKDSLLEALMTVDEYPQWSSRRFSAVEKFSTSELWGEWARIFKDRFNVNRKEDAKSFFEEHKEEMLEGTEVLWPDGDPYYDLMVYQLSNSSGFECLDGGTEILLPDFSSKSICDISAGDDILSGDGSVQKVIDVGISDLRDRNVFDIKVAGYDKKLRVTEDHPFLIYPKLTIGGVNCTHQHLGRVKTGIGSISKRADKRILNNKLVWKQAGDLGVSDAVVLPHNRSCLKSCKYCNEPDDWLFMVGVYIAEGSLGSNGNLVQFSMHSDENEILDRIRNFVGKGTIYTYDNSSRLDISSKELSDELKCFGSLSHEKTISYLKDNLCEACFMKLLEGIIVGDGYITHNRKYRSVNSASYTLIRELQYSLCRFGLVSYVYKLRDNGKCRIKGIEYDQRELYQIALVYENKDCRPLQSWFFEDKLYSKIQSIDKVDVDNTYKPFWMSVTGDKTFCIPMSIVHNSEKQNNPRDPTKIIVTKDQLHWEYFRNSPKIWEDIEKGIFFGAIDPSLGKKGGDDSVIATVVRGGKSGHLYVLEFDIRNRSVDEQIDVMIRYHQKHPYKLFGVETNAFQYVIAENLRKKARKLGLNFPIKEKHQYHDKKMRFEGIVPLLTDGTIVFDTYKYKNSHNYNAAIDQIVTFTGEEDRRDDAVDALVLAIETAAQSRFKMVTRKARTNRRAKRSKTRKR